MYEIVVHIHSIVRWLVLAALIYAIYQSITARKKSLPYAGAGKKTGSITLSLLHLQFVIGLAVYFQSPWFTTLQENTAAVMGNSASRFFALEHPLMMLVAVILGTIGNAKAKRAASDMESYRKRSVWFIVVLILILLAIPWPFRFSSAQWF